MRAYAHCNQQEGYPAKRGTIAIDLPVKDDLEALFEQHGTVTLIKLGAARLAKRAKFVKKQGRAFAEEMMDFYPCYLKSVEIRGIKHIYHFVAENIPNKTPDEERTQKIVFGLSTVAETEDVHLVFAQFWETSWDFEE